jgi:hypothetical protein
MTQNKIWGAALAGLFAMMTAGTAAAQDPESGDTGGWQQQPQQGGWQQQQPQQGGGWQQQPPQGGGAPQGGWQQGGAENERPPGGGGGGDSEAPTRASDTDHGAVVGNVGVGWYGLGGVPLGAAGGGPSITVSTPAVGVRYWLSEGVGLDVALGFGYTTSSGTVDTPDAVTDIPGQSGFALTVHGGLPLSLYQGKHYSFQIVPELDLGFGSGTIFGATPDEDQELGAFFFQVGARAGAELHFGFIGVPQLALQATVGVSVAYVSGSLENNFGDPRGSTITTTSGFQLGTTVQDEPWDIFAGSLRAIYYWL